MSFVLEVKGLTVNFGGILAVNSVEFGVVDGQIIGLIGPNGAGKTTILDAISGFVPSTGRILLNDTDIGGWSPSRRAAHRLGRSFQDGRLYPSLTVGEVLAVALERHHRAQDPVSSALRLPWVVKAERRIRRRVDELIDLMGLGAYRDKFANELSTGTRRIVDLACILAHEPEVLLLDEPSSGIAQRETEALAPMLRQVQAATGCSMLVVEHDMPLISRLADKLIALDLGAVISVDTPDRVLNDAAVVEAYLGTNRAMMERSGARAKGPKKEKEPVPANGKVAAAATRRQRAPAAASSNGPAPKKAPAKKTAAVSKSPAKKTAPTNATSPVKAKAPAKTPAKTPAKAPAKPAAKKPAPAKTASPRPAQPK